MGLSFEDSLKAAQAEVNIEGEAVSTTALSVSSEEDYTVMTLDDTSGMIAAYSDEETEIWGLPSNAYLYTYYDGEYGDEDYSTVDANKNITLSQNQINLTQETNSQYIPFKIPRYYDQFDLSETEISIYWVNKSLMGSSVRPVDVYCNAEYIRFAWLIDGNVTQLAGKIEFEIQARGTNSKGLSYIWKTKSNDGLNVLQALEVKTFIQPDASWQTDFLSKIDASVLAAQNAATTAQNAADAAKVTADNLQDGIATEVQNAMGGNYYTKSEVDDKIASADINIDLSEYAKKTDIPTNVSAFANDAGYLIEHQDISGKADVEHTHTLDDITDYTAPDLSGYALVEQIPNVEGLASETYVQEEIAKVDVSDQLADYALLDEVYLKEEVYTKDNVDELLDNVEVDLTGYVTESQLVDYVTVDSHNTAVSGINQDITDINNILDGIDTSPRASYETTYNEKFVFNGEEQDGTNTLVLYEIYNKDTEDETRSVVAYHTITGGSGGVGSANTLKINRTTPVNTAFTVSDDVIIEFEFIATDENEADLGQGYATWKIGSNTIINKEAIKTGKHAVNLTEYFNIGNDQKLTLIVTDDIGTMRQANWYISIVDVRLDSSFIDSKVHEIGQNVGFTYTPYGGVDKTIHFILDGDVENEVTQVSSKNAAGRQTTYIIPAQTHGSHLFEAYMTADIGGKKVESNHIVKDILWRDPENNTPIIGCATPVIKAMQYNTVSIKYTVFDPKTETPKVTWSVNGEVLSVETLTEKDSYGYYTYAYKANDYGTFELAVTCGDAEPKVITLEVEELDIDVSPVVAGLAFDFNPIGYSNNSADRMWSYNDVTMTVSDNFDWVNGGYQTDENGDQYFCVKAGTSAVINYNLFADDPKGNGKEFKVIFRTKNIRKRDTSFLTCMNDNIGLDMKIENATIYNSGGSLKSDYCEDSIIEYEFNINKNTDMMIVMSYEDGTPSKPYEYNETSSFKQSNPQPIIIGSEDCDVFIYRIKAYSNSLTDIDIQNNFIADARNADEMIVRYNRNQIYNENGDLVSTSANGGFSADALMKAAPDLRYIFIEVPQFTNDKDNKIDGCTVYFKYPAGDRPEDNWTCTGVRHRGQGTSSNLYGYAGRNIDLCMDRDESLFTWEDEEGNIVESSTITLTDTSVPTDYLNIKVNIASSENANNAGMAKRFNEFQPFLRYARKKDGRVKDTMEFHNCVVFIRETSEDSSVEHREFSDTNWHFYAIGNIGDSKKTDDTRVNNKQDPKEHVVEIMDADVALAAFPTGKEGNAVCPIDEWHEGNSAYDILYSTEYVYDDEDGSFKSFANESYEFRYEMKNITAEQREENINAWRNLYKFIATSTDEEFYTHLKDYFVVDSALYFYLFTERYTMVDNRAKNSFWHYGKVYISSEEATTLGETEASYYIIDNEAAAINDGYRYDLTFGYDFDTCLGIDNTGDYVFSYGKEDTDYYVDGDPSSNYVFRVADSVFFCRLRDLFPLEMQIMFKDREDKGAWAATSLVNQWDESQSQFPEELWRLDYERKYYRTYLGLSIDNSISKGADKTFLIGKFFGRKKYARRAFEINQEIYFATKYFGGRAFENVLWIRGNKADDSDYSLTLVPYSDMYVCVQYGSTGTPIHKKTKAGGTCVFESDADSMDFIYVYAADYIQEVGDLSKCYVGDNSFAEATRLQKLVIGSDDEGYDNPFMKEVLVGNNPLLEHLDVRNVSGINTVINVSGCGNLKELYAEGTNATGVIFANGGLLQTAHLPKVTSLSMKNLNYIEDFVVDGYDNLQTLIVENTPNINTYDMVVNAPLLKSVRLIGLNWDSTYQIEDASIFDRLLTIDGIDSSGIETDMSILTGNARVAVIKEQQSNNYKNAWPDLQIMYSTLIEQIPVTFVNYDGTVLEVQYVDKGSYAVDPTSRVDNPIPKPTKESTISTDYTFDGWNNFPTEQVHTAYTVTAVYKESLREYTIKYMLHIEDEYGNVTVSEPLYTSSGEYGTNVDYVGDTPIYVNQENGFTYYLFNRWDKSGFIEEGTDGTDLTNGVKIVRTIFDRFHYNSANDFAGKKLKDLSPVEIYALTKLNADGAIDMSTIIEDGNDYSFTMGYDVDYDDIESVEIISEKTSFTGSNKIDTGIKLFEENRDFVIAIDYRMSSNTSDRGILAQCYQTNGKNGFKLSYNNGVQFAWGTSYMTPSAANCREIIVLRYTSGNNTVKIYSSNLGESEINIDELTNTKHTNISNELVLGCAKIDDGSYEDYAIGDIYWCKVWYKDLGEESCKKLVGWTHEEITLEVCGFKKYFLTDNPKKRCNFTLLATHLLERPRTYNGININSNTGGWASSKLNSFLNTRMYNAIPHQIKSLLKQVTVSSSIGQNSTELSSSQCYITIPAAIEVSNESDVNKEPYISEASATISYMISDDMRKRAYENGEYAYYWLRSPFIHTSTAVYVYAVKNDGKLYGYNNAYNNYGVLIEISF